MSRVALSAFEVLNHRYEELMHTAQILKLENLRLEQKVRHLTEDLEDREDLVRQLERAIPNPFRKKL